ncbi:hypothetical protein EYC84_004619 [Monilinia fructicola]|uniref:Uncharacterized protein n=1 Tax=Monilinia fructicola TaxID=38448 RepID=A0A5M9K9A6_MONFR|nr:hypothetical protein EYC84_004619 [Monilinia fructicola]
MKNVTPISVIFRSTPNPTITHRPAPLTSIAHCSPAPRLRTARPSLPSNAPRSSPCINTTRGFNKYMARTPSNLPTHLPTTTLAKDKPPAPPAPEPTKTTPVSHLVNTNPRSRPSPAFAKPNNKSNAPPFEFHKASTQVHVPLPPSNHPRPHAAQHHLHLHLHQPTTAPSPAPQSADSQPNDKPAPHHAEAAPSTVHLRAMTVSQETKPTRASHPRIKKSSIDNSTVRFAPLPVRIPCRESLPTYIFITP